MSAFGGCRDHFNKVANAAEVPRRHSSWSLTVRSFRSNSHGYLAASAPR